MNIKPLTLDHPLFKIATNMYSKFIGSNVYPRTNHVCAALLRDGIVDFVLDKEDEGDEDE